MGVMFSGNIMKASIEDMDVICQLIDDAIQWQVKMNFPSWSGYDINFLKNEIIAGQLYKLIKSHTIIAIFTVAYQDPVIWRERDNNNALYLHRIVTNQLFRGQKQFEKILEWSRHEAMAKDLKYIRMDTWSNNEKIIMYYKSYNFDVIEYYTTPNTPELSFPYRNLDLALLELEI